MIKQKFILPIVVLFCLISISGQTKVTNNSFTLSFHQDKLDYNLTEKLGYELIDYFNITDPSKPGEYKLPSTTLIVAIPPNSNPSIKVIGKNENVLENTIPEVNPEIIRLNDSTLVYKEIQRDQISTMNSLKPIVELGNKFWFRDFYCVEVIVNSHQFDPSRNAIIIYEDVQFELSFNANYNFKESAQLQIKSKFDSQLISLIYNNDIAEQFRSINQNHNMSDSDSWINYAQDYIKIPVAKDAIFKITKADLSGLGISVNSIDPRKFQLFEGGSEQPIFISGENDGMFDDSDFILFSGSKHYSAIDHRAINSDSDPYNTFLDIYTDTSYYFLTWGGVNGKRYTVELNTPSGSFDILQFHTKLIHKEENSWYQNLNNDEVANQTSNWNKNKTWYWNWIFEGTRNFTIALDNIYPSISAKLYFKLTSGGSNISTNSHQTALRFNNAKIDSQSINRFKQALFTGVISSSNLKEGNNIISVQNYANGTLPNYLAYDWYEVEYPRYNILMDDSLIITIPDGLTNQIVELQFTNANAISYEIFKIVGSPKKIENYSISGTTLSFVDTVTTGEKYYIISSDRVSNSELEYIGQFTNLKNNSSQADYIAITPKIFSSKVDEYLNQIENLYDVSTKKILVEDIFYQFGYGYPTPESIKEFTQYAYNNWSSPKPSYLVLLGDASYDYKDYVLHNVGVKLSHNYIPAFGNPVSDNWYAIWGDGPNIPQLKVGRVPILELSDLDHYLSKIVSNATSDFDDWNKRYLFFSGGNGNNPTELKQLKAANDSLIANVIESRPISGNYTHFHKTSDPISDFGPFTPDQVSSAIDNGGLFISYVGHSGTATWDNSINEVSQLKNNVDRNPVISDFGCSTNKYAEPDIICFGERFLLSADGQALNYIGNSSLGFTSTAIPSPNYFYESFLTDSLYEVGNAHINAKSKLYQIFGNSQVFKVFSLSNVILGDPAVRLKIPNEPNLTFDQNPLLIESENLSDIKDSSVVQLIVINLGSAPAAQYNLLFNHFFQDDLIETKTINNTVPGYKDTLSIWIKTNGLAGEHRIEIDLDPDNQLLELNEDDNIYSVSFNIFSSTLHDLLPYPITNGKINSFKIVNPIKFPSNQFQITTQISESETFANYQSTNTQSGVLSTAVNFSSLNGGRYWLRYKINDGDYEFSAPKSFYNSKEFNFFVNDDIAFKNQFSQGLYHTNTEIKLSVDTLNISVLSAGWYSGATCVIAKDAINLLDNSFFAGMGLVVFDPSTMKVDTTAWFQLFANTPNAEALAALINDIPEGKIVAMGVADDGQNRLIASLRTAIKTLGSTLIDQLKFRGSWAMIGRKGASPGDPDIIEEIRGPYDGAVYLEKEYIVPNSTGSLTTTLLGPVSSWDSLYVNYNIPTGASIDVTPIGIRKSEQVDTLAAFNLASEYTSLSFINPATYPYAKLQFKFTQNENAESPIISSIGVNHQNAAELAINYQTASLSRDTLMQGEALEVNFKVGNVGESDASNVINKVDLYKGNNFIRNVFDSTLAKVEANTLQDMLFGYLTKHDDGYGVFKFVIQLDVRNNIVELYEDNNSFELPFTVIKDTVTSISSAVVSAEFDGYEIYDGDYVSSEPTIDIILDYEGQFEISDTNSVEISLNGKRINFSNLNATYNTPNRQIIYKYSPDLKDGDYTLSVIGENVRPANSDENNFIKFFKVSSESKILYPCNFPNPFVNQTHFTFKLTQVPDELKIKIFTIAGRLVREIKVQREELNFDFNRIYWDGRDEDGDQLANGVYLYKIISYNNEEVTTVTSKLAIVR